MPDAPAAPAASAPAPTPAPAAAPVAAPKPVTPPLPSGQAASAPKPAGIVPPTNTPPKPPPTVESGLRELGKQVFEAAPDKAETPAPEAKPEAKPDPKPAASAPEKSPFDGMELPDNASEAQKSNFKTLKAQASEEVNRLKNERATLAKELDTYKKATPADTAELTRIQTELREAQDRLAVFDVSSHPDFRRQYTEPKQKAIATATTLLADNAVEGAPDLKNLLDRPRAEFAKAISEAASKMPIYDQADFTNSMREAYRVHAEEKGALSKAGEVRAALQAKAAQEARSAFEASRGEFTQKIPPMEIPEGASEERVSEIRAYNQAREAAIAEAEKLTFGSMNERQVADVATRAAALNMVATHTLPMLQRELKEARDLIAAQHEQLKGIAAKKNGGSFAPPADTGKPPEPGNLRDLRKQVFGE